MAASSSLVHSRAATTRENPIDSSRRAPSALWTTICVEACSGILGVRRLAGVLHNHGVHAGRAGGFRRPHELRDFLFEHNNIERQVYLDAPHMAPADSVRQMLQREVFGVAPRIEHIDAEIHCVRAAEQRRVKRGGAAGRPARALISPPALSGPLSRARQAGGADGRFHA